MFIERRWLKHVYDNPLRTTAIQKLLEMIGRVCLCPSYSFATALDSDINQTAGSGDYLSMWENRCMHGTVCLLRAGQPRRAGAAAKSGQFVGQFSWVTGDPIVLNGLRRWEEKVIGKAVGGACSWDSGGWEEIMLSNFFLIHCFSWNKIKSLLNIPLNP